MRSPRSPPPASFAATPDLAGYGPVHRRGTVREIPRRRRNRDPTAQRRPPTAATPGTAARHDIAPGNGRDRSSVPPSRQGSHSGGVLITAAPPELRRLRRRK